MQIRNTDLEIILYVTGKNMARNERNKNLDFTKINTCTLHEKMPVE